VFRMRDEGKSSSDALSLFALFTTTFVRTTQWLVRTPCFVFWRSLVKIWLTICCCYFPVSSGMYRNRNSLRLLNDRYWSIDYSYISMLRNWS
jgi:hypothetical protein